jgi:osmotically-inducible protein OsmY
MIQVPTRSTTLRESPPPSGARPELDRVAERSAARRLEGHPHFRGRQRFVQCSVQDGVLTLSGCVPSYFLKAVAQEALRELPGVHTLRNQIQIAGRAGNLNTRPESGDCTGS